MKRQVIIQIALALIISVNVFAQQAPAPAARRGPQPIPLFLKETWKDTAAIPVTQAGVANPDLELKIYGATKDDMTINNEGGVPHVWTGLCPAGCAVMLRHKDSFADLTGKARARWYTKTSGFHQVRPIVKLADGTWLVGDRAEGTITDWIVSEVNFSELRWLKLDIERVVTTGNYINNPDLSKVDEIGFADLMPGSGHGAGGWSDVAQFEVFGKAVSRK